MMMISVVVFMRGRLLQRLGHVYPYLTGPMVHPSRTSLLLDSGLRRCRHICHVCSEVA